MTTPPSRRLFPRLSPGSASNLVDTLRAETAGGLLLLLGAAAALVWANSPWSGAYTAVRDTQVGPAALGLTVGEWTSDGLLSIFFFVVGLELKREIVAGQLRRLSTAVTPVIAAVGGMAAPAAIYLAVNLTASDGVPGGWAVPTATDIAFAVGVLAIAGRGLPTVLKAFLLTLAVADDLLAVVIIAVVFTGGLDLLWLGVSIAMIAAFAVVVRRHAGCWPILLPLAVAAWAAMHASGVHATIAGVLLGFTVPARGGSGPSAAERLEHVWRPVSAGVAVPLFALFAAGVTVTGPTMADAVADPAAQGIALALVLGKPAGIMLGTAVAAMVTRAGLMPGMTWADVAALGSVAGIGFTVSLLISELSFDAASPQHAHAKIAVLLGSVVSAILGSILLRLRAANLTAAAPAGSG